MPQGCRVLIVDDYADARRAMEKLLRREGFQTCTAGSLAEADTLLDGQEAVILDLDLPDGDGADLLKRIREEGRPIRVAVFTATQPSLSSFAVSAADAFFEKPLTSGRLDELLDWLGT